MCNLKIKKLMDKDKKEYLYNELNIILEYLDNGDNNLAAVQLEGLINELKYDQL
tara:strand:- start:718 stop:879 length:162 start_codon:yes stop_codon:yes gene_type:complete